MTNSTSSPTYPACVNGVASDMENGTCNTWANVRANKVLPDPVGPINMTLLLSYTVPSSMTFG